MAFTIHVLCDQSTARFRCNSYIDQLLYHADLGTAVHGAGNMRSLAPRSHTVRAHASQKHESSPYD